MTNQGELIRSMWPIVLHFKVGIKPLSIAHLTNRSVVRGIMAAAPNNLSRHRFCDWPYWSISSLKWVAGCRRTYEEQAGWEDGGKQAIVWCIDIDRYLMTDRANTLVLFPGWASIRREGWLCVPSVALWPPISLSLSDFELIELPD